MVKWREATLRALISVVILVLVPTASADDRRDPQFRRRVNCEKLKDGNYVFGCSRFYSICTNGIEYPMHCFEGLVINPTNNQCDAPKDVSICQKSGDTNLYRSKDPFTCAGRADGNYESQICSAFYYQCHEGQQFERPCPQGLAYSPKQKTCDFIDKCKREAAGLKATANLEIVDPNKGNSNPNAANANAKLSRRSSNGAARRNTFSTGYPSPPDSAPAYQQPLINSPASQPIESSVVEDGFIVDESENSSGQEAPVQPSPQSYAPAPAPQANPAPQNYAPAMPPVARKQPVAPAIRPKGYWGSSISAQPAYASPPAPKTPVFHCSGKEDGVYLNVAATCTDTFYKCSNGNGFQYTCPATLFYNVDNNQCDHKQNVLACGGQSAPPTTTAASSLDYTATRKPVVFDCSKKVDGYYQPELCSSVFFSCIGGMESQINCPAGTVFDISALVCDYPSQCGQPRNAPAPQMQSPAISHGNTDYYMQEAVQQQTPQTTTQKPAQQIPVYEPAVAIAPQPAQQYLVPQPGYQPPVSVYQPVQLAPAPQPIPSPVAQPPKFSCAGKQDGYYYKKPCTASFLICSAGQVSTETCPGNLVFDPTVAHCQYPDVCGKPSLGTTIAPPQPQYPPTMVYPQAASPVTTTAKPVPDFDCTGLPDGYTYKKPCTTTFYTCASGHTIELHCPASLVFDPVTVTCHYPDECGKPKAERPAAPVAQNPAPQSYYNVPTVAYTTAAPITPTPVQQSAPVSELNCVGRPDGYYWKEQCAPIYFSCSGGHAYPMHCSSGLVFDPAIRQCDYASECGKPRITTVAPQTTAAPVASAPSQQNQPGGYRQQQGAYQQQQSQPNRFTCDGRIDGYYIKKSCTTPYFSCVGGVASQLTCPAGLVFDVKTANCEYPEECGKGTTTTTPAAPMSANAQQQQPYQAGITVTNNKQAAPYSNSQAQQQPSSSNTYNNNYAGQSSGSKVPSQAAPATTAQPQVPASEFDCSQRKSGHYSKGCSGRYFSCHAGTTYAFQCPAQLMYSQTIAACDHLPNVPECGGKPPQEPTTTQTYAQQQSQQQQQPVDLPYPASCGNLTTGTHMFAPCSANYLTCWNGQKGHETCFNNLVYNPVNGQCDFPINVQGCAQFSAAGPVSSQVPYGVNSAASQPSSSSSGYSSQPQQQQQQLQAQMEPKAIPPNVCQQHHQTDGYIAIGCSSQFFHCSGDVSRQLSCGPTLFYDMTTGNCDYKQNVPACGGKRTAPPANPPVQMLPSSPSSSSSNQASASSVSGPEFDCSKQPNGYFSKGCSGRYYACHSGTGYLLHCPSGLKYSQQAEACDFDTKVSECGGSAGQTSTPTDQQPVQTAAGYPIYPYVHQQQQQQRQQPETPAAAAPPPADYHGQQIKEKALAPPQPQSVQQDQQEKPKPRIGKIGQNTMDYLVAGGDPCASLAPGLYARPCSPHYFKCTHKKQVVELVCPEGNVFDVQRGGCTPQAHVADCLSSDFGSNSEMRVY